MLPKCLWWGKLKCYNHFQQSAPIRVAYWVLQKSSYRVTPTSDILHTFNDSTENRVKSVTLGVSVSRGKATHTVSQIVAHNHILKCSMKAVL